MRCPLAIIAVVVFSATPAASQAQSSSSQIAELKKLSIEELAEADVTGSGRRPERLDQVASAVTVITSDDLRRYGVMTLPEALRLADTMHVARVAGAGYAISMRGFNITTANKLLVMIDGRTVYSPVFSGVFWEAQDLVIADIERIEVVRGPGGTLWGANSVNGVIHVITKNASDTRGTFVNAAVGTDGQGPFAVRHGGRFGTRGSYRVYGKVRFDDPATLLAGGSVGNDHDFGQAGFRVESDRSGSNFLVVQGDAFEGRSGLGENVDRAIRWRGANLMTRWTHRNASGAETTVQAYYDHFYRRVPVQYRGTLHTLDLDVQHQRSVGRSTVVVGGGYRHYRGDDFGDGPGFFFEPRERVSHRANVFAQAEVKISANLFVAGGTKIERNEFTGAELQPSASARWTAGRQTAWASVSRAVRVPTRFDTDLRFRVPNTDRLALTGTDDFRSESVVAYEAGYRTRIGTRLSIDVAAFENHYDHLRSQEVPVPPIPVRLMNMMNGVTRGVELTAKAQLNSWWQVGGGYTHFWKRITFDPGSTDRTGGAAEGNDPRHIVNLRSHIDVRGRLEFDAFYRYVGALPSPAVAGYGEFDARLGYRVRSGLELAAIGTDLLNPQHLEFRGGTPPQVYRRGVTLRATWRF